MRRTRAGSVTIARSFCATDLRILPHADGIAVRLRHLTPIESRNAGRGGEQHLRLGQDRDAAALQEAEQTLPVRDGDASVARDEHASALERLRVAGFLELAAQLFVGGAVAAAETLHGALGPGLEIRLPSVQMIESAGGLACQLHMRDLIFPHGYVGRAVDEDVGALQQWITEEPVRGEILLLERLLLILVARNPLQPAQGRHHGQQQVQLGVLGDVRLDKKRGDPGIQAGRQPVDDDVLDVLLEPGGVLVPGGEHVPVGDEEEALVLVLQIDPVAQCPVVVAQVQAAGRAHAGQHAPRRSVGAHAAPVRRALSPEMALGESGDAGRRRARRVK